MSGSTQAIETEDNVKGGRQPRADYAANHAAILDAAELAIILHGTEVTLDTVITDAGVGSATFYRHFPSRLILMREIFRRSAAIIDELAAQLVATDSAREAIELFAQQIASMAIDHPATLPVVSYLGRNDPEFHPSEELYVAVGSLIDAAHAEGYLHPDIGATDLIFMLLSLGSLAPYLAVLDPELWRRYVQIILRGMQKDQGEVAAFVPPAATPEAFVAIMHGRTVPRP